MLSIGSDKNLKHREQLQHRKELKLTIFLNSYYSSLNAFIVSTNPYCLIYVYGFQKID